MAGSCGRTPVASLALNDREINRRSYGAKLDRFLDAAKSFIP